MSYCSSVAKGSTDRQS